MVLLLILQICIYFVTYMFLLLIVTLIGFKIYGELTKGTCTSKARLDGKVALITGGNTGIGFETAKDLAKRGARVVVASRDVNKSAAAVANIKESTGNDNVDYRYLDLSKFSEVRKFAEDFNNSFERLDILVNNAGVAGLKHRITDDGIDIVTQVNYFSPFLLTNLLLDKLIASKPSRIVIVSSRAHFYAKLNLKDLRHTTPMGWPRLYANSKLLNVLWAKALARKLPEGVTANVLHPGVVKTDIFDRTGPTLKIVIRAVLATFFKSSVEGAQTTIHLAVAQEVENISGKYFVDCKVDKESKTAKDEDVIEKVWQDSLLITKLK